MRILIEKIFLCICISAGLIWFGLGPAYGSDGNVPGNGGNEPEVSDTNEVVNFSERPLTAKGEKQSSRPNILLIGIETLRADHVGHLGYHRDTTPTFDKLAEEGVAFSRAIATSSWTMPTVMSVLTSLYPGVHKMTGSQKKLPEGRNTLADILKKNDYVTAAFISNPTLNNRYGFSKGFDLYDDFSVDIELDLNLFEKNDKVGLHVHNAKTNEVVNHASIDWLRKNHDKPFFMFVFYFDPHYDYIPPPPFDTVFDHNYDGSTDGRGIIGKPRPPQRDLDHIIALYDGEILYTDSYISKLLGKFTEYGILDDTLIIVFGDHGDEFYEHGSTAHGSSLYSELTHIPLAFRWPSVIPRGRRVSAMVSQVDIMPTILDYLNIEHDGFMQGSSLRPLIEGRKEKLHDMVYGEISIHANQFFAAAISKDHKFILDLNTGKKQLFDLNNDPNEQVNIYEEKSLAGPVPLEDHLTLWLINNTRLADQLSNEKNSNKVELDEEHIKQLKALGYLQ